MKEVLKIKTVEHCDEEFEQYCKNNNIYFKPYPDPIKHTYRVDCEEDDLAEIGHCLISLEPMPIATLD